MAHILVYFGLDAINISKLHKIISFFTNKVINRVTSIHVIIF